MLIIIYLYSYTVIRQHLLFPQHKLSLTPLALIDFCCTYRGGTENSTLLSDILQMLSNLFLCGIRTQAERAVCIWAGKAFVLSPGEKASVLQLNPYSWLASRVAQSLEVRSPDTLKIPKILRGILFVQSLTFGDFFRKKCQTWVLFRKKCKFSIGHFWW